MLGIDVDAPLSSWKVSTRHHSERRPLFIDVQPPRDRRPPAGDDALDPGSVEG
jgi:hypothetical protein